MNPKRINVLIACEESQAECIAFRAIGFNAFSCDIVACRKGGHPEWHIQADVTPLLSGLARFMTMDGKRHRFKKWHLIIAHPPCTYLSKVGSLHLYKDADTWVEIKGVPVMVNGRRWWKMGLAIEFFKRCLAAKAKYVAVENPIPMAIANLPKPNCYCSPHWYGVKYTKKTLYWTKNLPPLFPERIHPHPKCYVTSSRGKYRSRTFTQVAEAIAAQWGAYILNSMIRAKKQNSKERTKRSFYVAPWRAGR